MNDTSTFVDGFYFHQFHRDNLLTWLTADEARARHEKINTVKPEAERPERNRRFQPADLSSLPEVTAAWAALDQAWAALDQAWAAYNQAIADNMPAILALHAEQCPDCLYTPDHPEIFEGHRD